MNNIRRQESTSFVPSTNILNNKEMSLCSEWTKEQNEAYEKALASLESDLDLTNDEELEKILRQIPGNKTLAELKEHHQKLVDDVANIVSGKVPLPSYTDDKKMKMKMKKKNKSKPKMDSEWHCSKGEPWTVLEHKIFLEGLEKFGKGSWKSISRILKTRTSTQVASHAQKYFARVKKAEEKKKMLDEMIYDLGIGDKDVKGDNVGGSNGDVAQTQMGKGTEPGQCALLEPVINMGNKEGSRYYHPVLGDLRPFYPRWSNNEVRRIMDNYARRQMGMGMGMEMRKEQKRIADTGVGSSVGNNEGSRHYRSVLDDYRPFYPRWWSNTDNMMIMGDNGRAQMEMGAEMRQEQKTIVDTGLGSSVGNNEGSWYYPRRSSNNDNTRIIGDNARAQMEMGTKMRKVHKTIADTRVGNSVGNIEGSRYYPRWWSNNDNMRIMGDNGRAQMGMSVEMRKEQKTIADIGLGSNVANNEESRYYCPVLGNYRPFYPRRWSNNDNMRIMSDNGQAQMEMGTEMRKEQKSIADTGVGSNMVNNEGSRYYCPTLDDLPPLPSTISWCINNEDMRTMDDNARTHIGMEEGKGKEHQNHLGKDANMASMINVTNNEGPPYCIPYIDDLPPLPPATLSINNEDMGLLDNNARTQMGVETKTEKEPQNQTKIGAGAEPVINVANNEGSQYQCPILDGSQAVSPTENWWISDEDMKIMDELLSEFLPQ